MSENPKHYAGAQKIPFGDVPGIIEAELSLAMAEGARKYGGYNYRRDPVRAGDYYAAARRHLTEFWELGEDIDVTCGLSHLTKAMACLAVLRDAQINGMMIDDRPPSVSRTQWDHLANVANDMRAKYPEPKARVTEWPKPEEIEPAYKWPVDPEAADAALKALKLSIERDLIGAREKTTAPPTEVKTFGRSSFYDVETGGWTSKALTK